MSRVYCVGAHSVGKTELVEEIARTYGLPDLAEVARQVLAKKRGGLKALAGNLDGATRFQEDVFRQQIQAEAAAGEAFVSDRAFDNLVYAARWARAGTVRRLLDAGGREYLDWVRSGVVFFVRPHRELLEEDGTRAHVTWEDVLVADGGVLFALEVFDIPYVPVPCREFPDRMRIVEGRLGPPGRKR